jgi:hypothetical protein
MRYVLTIRIDVDAKDDLDAKEKVKALGPISIPMSFSVGKKEWKLQKIHKDKGPVKLEGGLW